jgi:hypothetical protein
MSSKQLIESLANEDLFTAKKLIHEALTEKMGNALEEKLIDFAPTVFNEGKLSPKQKKIAKLAGDEDKIDAPDFAALRNKKKHVKEDVDEIQDAFEAELKSLVEEIEEETGEELTEEEIINIAEMLLDMINEDDTGEKAQEDDDEDIAEKDAEDKAKSAVKLQKPNTSNVRLGTNAEY